MGKGVDEPGSSDTQGPTLWTPDVAARDRVASVLQPNLPKTTVLGGRKVTILPLPCGRSLAVDAEGHVLGFGAPSERSPEVPCTRAAIADINTRLSCVQKSRETLSAEMCFVRARQSLLLEAVESLVANVRDLTDFVSGHVGKHDSTDADRWLQRSALCSQVRDQIKRIRECSVGPLDMRR